MQRFWLLNGLTVALLLLPVGAIADQFRFEPGCTLPYEAIKQAHPFDDVCNLSGESQEYDPGSQVKRRAHEAKNDLCAPEPAVLLTLKDFKQLMGDVEDRGIAFGRFKYVRDRATLRGLHTKTVGGEAIALGEGTRVRIVAYVADAKTSNVGTGEAVNCMRTTKVDNDIHITLVGHPDDPPCTGIVAEMIPHYRPTAWRDTAVRAIERPVRVTGHLFFDSPHLPCDDQGNPISGNPARVSLWEIHPVYTFEVCKHTTLAACRGDHDEDWTRLGEPEP